MIHRPQVIAMLVGMMGCAGQSESADGAPLDPIATVRQFGPVGYRDPVGVVSPDGFWLVTAAHHLLQVRDTEREFVPRTLPSGESRIGILVWLPGHQLLVGQADGGINWWRYDVERGSRQPFWPEAARASDPGLDRLRHLAVTSVGDRIAGVARHASGSSLIILDTLGTRLDSVVTPAELAFPHWLADGRIACLGLVDGYQRLMLPCGVGIPAGLDTLDAYGPLASSPDGSELYFSIPNARGFVDLWAWELERGQGRVLAAHDRDSYAPSVTKDGRVLYQVQDYRTEIAVMPAAGGPATRRTSFQAETPSWSPDGTRLGITYGTWRRVTDDFHYPDIAQEAGIIAAEGTQAASSPDVVVQDSPSEDQGLTWSPNGRWIAFHSHQQGSDDIWLRPADRAEPLSRISGLGRGAEVGWPRWSPDGRWIVFNGDTTVNGRARSLLWVVGVDQESGVVTVPPRAVPLGSLEDEVLHTEWLGSSEEIVFSGLGAGGLHTFYRVPRTGGPATPIHRYTSTQRVDGFGANADGSWLVFAQPDSLGRLQLFKIGTAAGSGVEQLTADSTEKTQPAVSPDGTKIAYTEWRYAARFYLVSPR